MKKGLKAALIGSICLFFAVLALEHVMLEKQAPWGNVYKKSAPVQALSHSEKMIVETCAEGQGTACDEAMMAAERERNGAYMFAGGFDYCIERLGKSPEECNNMINGVFSNQEMKQQRAVVPSSAEAI